MADAQAHGVFVVPVAGLPEHRLLARVVVAGIEAEVVAAERFGPFVAPAGQRARHFAHVVLGVRAAIGAEREQLHHLARVVLVRVPLVVGGAVEEQQHRGVGGDREKQFVEAAERHRAEQLVLIEHQLLAVDLVVGVREPVVEDERHPLHQLLVGAHHAVEPPAVVIAPGVRRFERVAFFVDRFRARSASRARRGG